jgi:hypothetical protein
MTLELNQIAPQVEAMGQSLDRQNQERQAKIQEAKALLKQVATAFDDLEMRINRAEQVQEAVRFGWLGAAPAGEPLDRYFSEPPGPEKITVIASDGSQIHPDRHAVALYYLVNVGAIVYQHGGHTPPEVFSTPSLYYKEEDVLDEGGLLIPASVVNVKRDLGELEVLAALVTTQTNQGQPVLAMVDGRLTLRTIDLPGRQQKAYESQYLGYLNQIHQAGATIAAYIDKPHSSFIMALLQLAKLPPDKIDEDTLRQNPFFGLIDAHLFDDLGPGQRTALFNQRAKANIEYDRAGHRVHFFYLNTGNADRPNLVRVEIPGWVAKDAEKLNMLHATLLRQARLAGGYPYALARAHELAIIPSGEREALETMLAVSLRRQGQTAEVSRKQHNKNLLGNG